MGKFLASRELHNKAATVKRRREKQDANLRGQPHRTGLTCVRSIMQDVQNVETLSIVALICRGEKL